MSLSVHPPLPPTHLPPFHPYVQMRTQRAEAPTVACQESTAEERASRHHYDSHWRGWDSSCMQTEGGTSSVSPYAALTTKPYRRSLASAEQERGSPSQGGGIGSKLAHTHCQLTHTHCLHVTRAPAKSSVSCSAVSAISTRSFNICISRVKLAFSRRTFAFSISSASACVRTPRTTRQLQLAGALGPHACRA